MSNITTIEKEIPSRVVHKHDIEANWEKAVNFIPKKAELIVYDPDTAHPYPRLKIGDGTNTVNALGFVRSTLDENGNIIADTYATIEHVDEQVEDLQGQIDGKEDSGAAATALTEAKGYTDEHIDNKSNPHGVTASQVGADPTGTATAAVSSHNTNANAHNDIRDLIAALNTKVNNFLDVDDTTKDELSEVIALIEANADLIEGITTSKVNVSDIINNLTTNVSNKPLSAAQGVILKGLIDTLETEFDNHTHNYAGSSSVGGSANSAVKLDSSAGSAIQPVYFSDGKPVKTTYTLEKSVPSDAKFTDTVYTHPAYTARTGVPAANQAPGFGGTFTVTQPVSDNTGHITAMNSRTVTIPGTVATSSAKGLMSAADKVKVDNLEATYATITYVDGLVGDIETLLAAI